MGSMSCLILSICAAVAACPAALAATSIDGPNDAVQIATPLQFPFMVNITSRANRKFCSGAVISSNAIVTSASCVSAIDNATDLDVVLLGNRQNVFIREINVHPQYSIFPVAGVTSADLAVLRSEQNFEMNGYSVDIIKLPTKKYENFTRKSAILAAANLITPPNDATLSFVEVNLMKHSSCQKVWSLVEFKLQAEQVCVENSVSCQAGAGGAVTIADKGSATIVAIAPGYDNCHASQPNVYSRVGPHVDWIRKVAFEI